MEIDSPNALGISTGFGIPTGGTANQILVKNSSTNYDTSWSDFTGTTLVQAQNTSEQSIANNSTLTITNWTNVISENATEWNPTNGVFTATKAGTYLVSTNLTYAPRSAAQSGNLANIQIYKNSTVINRVITPALNTASITRGLGTATSIINLTIGDTITVRTSHDFGSTATLSPTIGSNTITIQEIPTIIRR